MVLEVGVDLADLVEPPERQQDFSARSVGDLTADEAGIAALRHDLRPILIREAEDGRDFRRRARAHDASGLAMPEIARLAQKPAMSAGAVSTYLLADDRRYFEGDFAGGCSLIAFHLARQKFGSALPEDGLRRKLFSPATAASPS